MYIMWILSIQYAVLLSIFATPFLRLWFLAPECATVWFPGVAGCRDSALAALDGLRSLGNGRPAHLGSGQYVLTDNRHTRPGFSDSLRFSPHFGTVSGFPRKVCLIPAVPAAVHGTLVSRDKLLSADRADLLVLRRLRLLFRFADVIRRHLPLRRRHKLRAGGDAVCVPLVLVAPVFLLDDSGFSRPARDRLKLRFPRHRVQSGPRTPPQSVLAVEADVATLCKLCVIATRLFFLVGSKYCFAFPAHVCDGFLFPGFALILPPPDDLSIRAPAQRASSCVSHLFPPRLLFWPSTIALARSSVSQCLYRIHLSPTTTNTSLGFFPIAK